MERIKLGTRKVSIEFPGVKALTDVDFEVTTGEIHALVGANGAGKSTLMKVLAGANPDYTGEVYLNGDTVELRSTLAAKKLGIQIVYQEVDMALIPTLSVAENVMLNDTVMHGKTIMNWRSLYKRAAEVLQRLNIDVDVHKLVQDLSLAQKQMVLIARAIVNECNFLILDEPTAPLSDTETEELFKLVKHLQATENIAIIFISHRINEILRICERYTVMRNGRVVDTTEITSQTTTREIVEKMLGRSFEENFPKEVAEIGEIIFELDHLSGADGRVNDVSLYARKGEIVGVAGLVGAGKSELCKTIFGAYEKTGGRVIMGGRELTIKNPSQALKNRIALVPEERRKEGVLVGETVSFNISAASLDNVAKWMAADCDLYIFDEPTKGVDVGAKQDIFHLICDIAKRGNSVIYASCENSELLSITDRIYVLFDGQVMAELETSKTSEDEIMHYAVGNRAQYA